MKKTKVIIPALGILLLSTAASVTGTVAWFAANASVQATGVQITAKSDSSFLIIGTSDNLTTVQSTNATTADLSTVTGEVYPSAHETIANTAAANATGVTQAYEHNTTHARITSTAYGELGDEEKANYSAVVGTNWYTQVADAVTASTSTKPKQYLATLDSNYVLHTTIYVTMSVGSNSAANLAVKSVSFTQTNVKTGTSETMNPVRALVTSSTASVEFAAREGSGASVPNTTVLASEVTSSDLVQVDIYVYYDGNDADVFTNNVANLEGATIDLTFDVGRVS